MLDELNALIYGLEQWTEKYARFQDLDEALIPILEWILMKTQPVDTRFHPQENSLVNVPVLYCPECQAHLTYDLTEPLQEPHRRFVHEPDCIRLAVLNLINQLGIDPSQIRYTS